MKLPSDIARLTPQFSAPIPLSLYIHFPWCIRKCPYCDFNSHEAKGDIPEALYIETLKKDFLLALPQIANRSLVSIFFGGGTPSLFSGNGIKEILTFIHGYFPYQNIEITLEANPGTVDYERFLDFRHAGINRLSLGVQSFNDQHLKKLGRIHHRKEALSAVEKIIMAGFNNFNVDLMHGLPQQTLSEALDDLKNALGFSPPHLSWYQLTIEPQTLFAKYPPSLPDEEILWNIQTTGWQTLQQQGLQQYEISAFAREQASCCQHNFNYWQFGDYLGIGAGAHSKLTDIEKGTVTRHWQKKQPKEYLQSETLTAEVKILEVKDIIFEFMLNALRLTDGVSKNIFVERTGLPYALIEETLTTLQTKNLMTKNTERLQATPLGQQFLNDTIGHFLT